MGVQERAVGEWKDSEGNSYCDQINDDNKSKKCFSYHIYLLGVKCDICRDVQEEQVAIGSGNYYVGYAEDEEAKVAYDAGRVVKGPSNKRCPCGHCGARGCCRCAEKEIAERSAAHSWRERTQDSSISTYTERPRGPKFSHEKAVGRAYQWEETEMCIEECGNRDPIDYERCKNRCVQSALEKAVSARKTDSCIKGCQKQGPSYYAACEKRCYGFLEKSVSDWDHNEEWVCKLYRKERKDCKIWFEKDDDIAGCEADLDDEYKTWCSINEEKAVGGSWENGKCMSYGSYLTDAGATVNDMGTGWSESSCQSECDYSSTTKACQYEFSSQKCLMIGFYTNEIYGAGDYDALCYVK